MRLALNDEQVLLRESFARLFERESTIARVRGADGGFDAELWRALVASGAPLARVPEARQGLGLSLLDAALIAEEAGRRLASVPLVEVMVAARLLSAFDGVGEAWIARIAEGSIVAFAPSPAMGDAVIVPGGAVTEAVIGLVGEELVLVSGGAGGRLDNFGELPVGTWRLDGSGGERIVLARGADAAQAMQRALSEWRILSAAWLGALTHEALLRAAEYARERTQFGRPIGSFQGLAHPLADAVTAIEGAQLLVRRTIASIAEGEDDAAAFVALCWWWAARSANRALRQAIRTLGGYGLSLEYDLHLFHRRAHAVILMGGDPEVALSRAGDLLFTETRDALPDAGDVGISFARSDATRSHAARLAAFFAANWDDRMRAKAHHSSASHDADFHRRLAGAGLIFGGWPAEHGGLGHGPDEDFATTLAFEEWNYTSHVLTITNMVAQMVIRFGSEAAKVEILPRIKAGEAVCGLGFSEPASGSDVFAARTTAVRDGDDWMVDGQKMFTTGGHFADYVLLLARTSSDGPKHAGLTLFVVPTALPGYDVQPVHTYQDERTNITFYTGMRVPDRYRLGEVGGGGAVMGAALTLEHGGGAYFSAQTRMWRNALAWARQAGPNGTRPLDDPSVRRRLATVRARYEVAFCLVARGLAGAAECEAQRHWGPMAKLFITESFLDSCWDILEMGGPASIATGIAPLGMIELDHRRAYGTTIYGGTSEIHRSIIAEQALGLPKSRS